jgi:hypothetical protein
MAVSPILAIPLVAPTQADKTTTLNDMILDIEGAANDQLAVDMSAGNVTVSALQFTRFNVFVCSGLTAPRDLIVPLTKRVFAVRNSSAFDVTVRGTTGATVVVLAGNGAIVQTNGTHCLGYGSGGAGPPGITGPAGGAVNISYQFDTTTTATDPGPGKLRLNAGTQNAATVIYVDVLDQAGSDWTTILDTFDDSSSSPKGTMRIFGRDAPTHWIAYSLSSITSHTGWREFNVAVIGSSSANPFAAADNISLAFDRTGDMGNTGATGAAGPAGPIGSLAPINDDEMYANISGASAVPVGTTLSAYLDAALSAVQGTVLYRSGSAWSALAPGTAGQVLQTGGAAANPAWATPATATPRNQGRAPAQWVSGAVVTNDTIYLIPDTPYGGTVNSLLYFTGTGSFTVNIQINGVSVTGLGAVAVSSATPATATATAANTFAAGARITAVITGATGSPAAAVLSLAVTWSP